MKTKAIVGLDFVDAEGVRRFCFQICRHQNGRLESIALMDIASEGDVLSEERFLAIDSLARRRPAIRRLASVYMRRSVPMRFTKTLASANH